MVAQEQETKPKAKPSRRVNLKELFDVVDDIWGYIEKCESRNRFFGRADNGQIKSIRARLEPMRELLHGNPTDDRTD